MTDIDLYVWALVLGYCVARRRIHDWQLRRRRDR